MRIRLAIVMYYTQLDGDDVGISLCAQHARTFRPAVGVERMNVRGYELYCDLCVEEAEEPVRL